MLQPTRRVFSPRSLQICSRCVSTTTRAQIPRVSNRIAHIPSNPSRIPIPLSLRSFTTSSPLRASISTAKEAIERIEELYDNATEEFQIAAEETEGNTVYAADDRAAAKAEVEKLTQYYQSVVSGDGYEIAVREEVKKRAGTRVRELANAMLALEERAMNQD